MLRVFTSHVSCCGLQNKLNDAMEMLASLAAASGMSLLQKMNCAPLVYTNLRILLVLGPFALLADIFTMYNFDESGEFSVDEMTLALRSAVVGLAKITDDVPPSEADIEALSHDVCAACFCRFAAGVCLSSLLRRRC